METRGVNFNMFFVKNVGIKLRKWTFKFIFASHPYRGLLKVSDYEDEYLFQKTH